MSNLIGSPCLSTSTCQTIHQTFLPLLHQSISSHSEATTGSVHCLSFAFSPCNCLRMSVWANRSQCFRGYEFPLCNVILFPCVILLLTYSGICCMLGKCCQCNEAAFKLVAEMGITEDNVIHTSDKNEVRRYMQTVVIMFSKIP